MKLYLAVAVLMLAFAAHTKAQEEAVEDIVADAAVEHTVAEAVAEEVVAGEVVAEEPVAEEHVAEEPVAEEHVADAAVAEETVENKFTAFTSQMSEMSKNLADKAKTTLHDIQNSEFVANSQNWFQEQLDRVKAKFGEISE